MHGAQHVSMHLYRHARNLIIIYNLAQGDGCDGTDDETMVRVVFRPLTVNRMNQSRVWNILSYLATTHAESHSTLRAKMATLKKELCRLHVDGGRLKRDGQPIIHPVQGHEIRIKWMLNGDKPFKRHFLNLRDHTFEYPFDQCDCSGKQLWDMTFDPLTHFTGITFEVGQLIS